MLSRVAERIYWTGRHLQRVESAARLVNTYTNLLMDLPKGIGISWYNLITLNSAEEDFLARYKIQDERNVVKFIIADESNVNSLLSCLLLVKENLRTTRDVMPESVWEIVNELTIFTKDSIRSGALNRSNRHEFLTQIIRQCQLFHGSVDSMLSHDDVWIMWCLGRDLERADMTTRILDAGANVLFSHHETVTPSVAMVSWGNVLRSLGGDHAYRRHIAPTVTGNAVIQFLLFDDKFPRSVSFCSQAIERKIKKLPRGRKILSQYRQLCIINPIKINCQDNYEPLRSYLNDLQIKLGKLHSVFTDTWFSLS